MLVSCLWAEGWYELEAVLSLGVIHTKIDPV